MEKTIISKNENQSKNLFKFLIPSLFGLLLFVIPLPYGKLFKLDGLSPINIGIGFLAELIKIIAADYLINIALVVILASAILSVVSKFINIKNELKKGENKNVRKNHRTYSRHFRSKRSRDHSRDIFHGWSSCRFPWSFWDGNGTGGRVWGRDSYWRSWEY